MSFKPPKKSPPNIIWVFGDQHRSAALGCHGDPNLSTPNIDNLAQTGTDFRNAVGGFPLCCPFRGALLSSHYPQHAVPGHEYQLDPALPTVADAFNDQGYDTAYFGKWHVDGYREKNGRTAFHTIPPERRGRFQTWIGYENNNAQYDCWVHGHRGGQYAHDIESHPVEHYRLPGYETDELTDLLLDYVETAGRLKQDDKMKPFFAVLSVQPPHVPLVAPPEFRAGHTAANIQLRPNVPAHPAYQERAQRSLAGYYAMIENLDWNLGRIRHALREHELDRETYIWFFSDHGDLMGCHGQWAKMSPLEESIRVPSILGRGDNYEGFTGQTNTCINHVDYAPTSLGLCELDVPDWMQGTNYANEACGKYASNTTTHTRTDSAFIQSVVPTMHGNSVDRPWRGIVTRDRWKYVIFENTPWLLFNLNDDPYEQANLVHNKRFAEKRAELQSILADWIEKTDDQFALPELDNATNLAKYEAAYPRTT